MQGRFNRPGTRFPSTRISFSDPVDLGPFFLECAFHLSAGCFAPPLLLRPVSRSPALLGGWMHGGHSLARAHTVDEQPREALIRCFPCCKPRTVAPLLRRAMDSTIAPHPIPRAHASSSACCSLLQRVSLLHLPSFYGSFLPRVRASEGQRGDRVAPGGREQPPFHPKVS